MEQPFSTTEHTEAASGGTLNTQNSESRSGLPNSFSVFCDGEAVLCVLW